MVIKPDETVGMVDLVEPSNLVNTRVNPPCTISTIVESIDIPVQFFFPMDQIIEEINGYKSFLQVNNDMPMLTLSDIAKSENYGSHVSDTLKLSLTTDLRVHSERAKGRFFLVKLGIAYEVAFRYATINSVDVKAIPERPPRVEERFEEGAKGIF
jgi:hypothetical protein